MTIRLFFKACKDKKLLTFLFINSSHFTRAASDSSTVKLSQSSEVRTGCHCNHFLHKHTSHCWLPRWEASRDIGTLNIGRRRVGVRQHQFKPRPTTTTTIPETSLQVGFISQGSVLQNVNGLSGFYTFIHHSRLCRAFFETRNATAACVDLWPSRVNYWRGTSSKQTAAACWSCSLNSQSTPTYLTNSNKKISKAEMMDHFSHLLFSDLCFYSSP